MKGLIYILLTSLMISLASFAFSQKERALVSIDTNAMLIGDQVNVRIEASIPAGHLISWPTFEDTLIRNVEILKKTGLDTTRTNADGLKTYYQELLITSFDSGKYTIPSLKFYHGAKNDTITEVLVSPPVYFAVNTIEVDTTQDIKAIKPPLSAPYTFREALPWIMAFLGAVIAGLIIYYIIKRRKKALPIFPVRTKPHLPAHVIALNGLEELRHKKMWQQGKTKEYYTIMTDILREYIEERFGIRALEMTTYEIMGELKSQNINSDIKNKLGETLNLADLVKFAKEQPLPLENDISLNNSIDFVKETFVKEEKEEEKKGGAPDMAFAEVTTPDNDKEK